MQPPPFSDFNEKDFRHFMGNFATGVAIVTTSDPAGQAVGVTVNSLTSVSLKPPLVLFCLEKSAHTHSLFEQATHFGINILAQSHENISRAFADANAPQVPSPFLPNFIENCPVLKECLGWMICRKFAAHDGGDHTIFVGQTLQLSILAKNGTPLLYFKGHYARLAD